MSSLDDKARRLMRENLILRVAVQLIVPFILLFALYVQFHGDFGPGGGFQAGVIFATGLILFSLIFGLEGLAAVLPARVAEILAAVGVLIYGGVGVVTLLLGEAFLDYDAFGAEHGQHYGILAVELGVGVAVAATLVRVFYAFAQLRRGDSSEESAS